MSSISSDKREFRSLVLGLKNLNPSWSGSRITTFIQQSENPPLLKGRQLVTKVRRTLTRNTINDRQRSGRPITISTSVFQQQVKTSMRLRKGASIRNVTAYSNRHGIKCSTLLQSGYIRSNSTSKKNKKRYLTGDLYAEFLTEEAAPAINEVFENADVTPIFQDDQDNKHRTTLAKSTVADLFDERIDPKIGDAKLANIWPIEKISGAIKEKLRGQEFDSELDLEKQVAHYWKTFTAEKCRQMMEKIPKQLKLVIDKDGEQVFND